ncbi:hypothetical protein GCM10023215_34600 [Pseudonocardia yuanmonensis]|uniref:Uncharacterized protein n=1 Tax=Pseudonocardia yuanmonensis TaxID=1095914 RepID=A0ABP8WSA3_9PSEU
MRRFGRCPTRPAAAPWNEVGPVRGSRACPPVRDADRAAGQSAGPRSRSGARPTPARCMILGPLPPRCPVRAPARAARLLPERNEAGRLCEREDPSLGSGPGHRDGAASDARLDSGRILLPDDV